MSAAGDDRADPRPSPGFTLIEMLVVLAILGLVSGIAYPALDRALRRQAFLDACARVEAGVRSARAAALAEGRAVRVRGDADGHGFLYGDAEEPLPDAAVLRLPADGIAFYPDGSATGGDVVLRLQGLDRGWRVVRGTGRLERLP